MDKQSRYDSERLIQVATIANEISRASGLSSKGAIKRLVMAVESGELTSDLYPPFQKWRHGGKPETVEVPISNGADQWRSIAKQSASLHQSDKDEFNHPNTASTYHVLADDLFDYSEVCSIGTKTKEALRQLAVRYNPELADELVVTSPPPLALPAPAQTAPAPALAASDGPKPLPAAPNWKTQIQAEAYELFLRLLASGANPTRHSILDSMAQWCRDNDIRTDTKINPSANYLRTHVLGGKHWATPTMSREQAKKHVAQVAQVAQTKVAQVAQ